MIKAPDRSLHRLACQSAHLEAVNESAALVLSYMVRHGAGHKLPGMPHEAGVLNLPNPATLFGAPLNPRLSRSIGDLQPI
jgi:hypothetical protein